MTLTLALTGSLLAAAGPGPVRAEDPARTAAAAPGYWLVGTDGGIFSYGGAAFHGSTGNLKLNQPIVGMTPTNSAASYWMVAADGGIFSFGDARFFGSTGDLKLNKPIVGMASTPSGGGYWMVASDGGIFSFGDATFYGSTGSIRLNQPITAMASTPTGRGYWMAAVDGGLFSYGDAIFHGAGPQRPVPAGTTRQIVGMVPTESGGGYWQVAANGEVLAFGDAPALGAPANLNRPIVGMAAVPQRSAPPTTPGTPGGPFVPTNPSQTLGPPQFFSSVPNPSWGTSPSEDPLDAGVEKAGKVLSLAEAGDMVFVGGEFAGITAPGVSWRKATEDPALITRRPFLVALNRHTGELIESWNPRPDAPVLSLHVSPDAKKLYVGGRFRNIGGAAAGRVAVVDVATGQQDTSFRAPLASAAVKAMALHNNTLWIGGDFTTIDTTPRPQLAALDAKTGALKTGFVPPAANDGCYKGHTGVLTPGCDGVVQDLAITDDGKTLYVAGDFADFGGRGHGGLLTLNAATGAKSSWQAVNDRPIFGIAIWPGDGQSLYTAAGGQGGRVQFYQYQSSKRSTRPKWTQKVDGDAMDVFATNQRVYLGGHYNYVLGSLTKCDATSCTGSADQGDTPNRHLSAFDARTGSHDRRFTAQANTSAGPYVVHVGADHLYVGGNFTDIDDKPVVEGGTEYKRPGFVSFPALAEGR